MKNACPSYVGIIFDENEPLGTAFLVDASFQVLATAHHVIEDFTTGPIPLSRLSFQPFGVATRYPITALLDSKPVDEADIALLEIEPVSIEELPILSTDYQPTDSIWLIGFASEHKIQREYKSAQGKIMGPTSWLGNQVLELEIAGIYKGMSGAPVHSSNGKIIGILTGRIDENSTTVAHMTPVSVLAQLENRVATHRRRYLKNLIAKIITEDEKAPFSIKEYVPIPVALTDPAKKDAKERYNNVFDLLEKNARFALVGEAGSGKSASIRAMVLSLARQALENDDLPLPVWINLHHWRDDRKSFLDFITDYLQENGLEFPIDLKSHPQHRTIVFLLDELDELLADNIRILNDWVHAQKTYSIIVGCRDSQYHGIRDLELPIAVPQPLSISEVFIFAKNSLQDVKQADDFISLMFPNSDNGDQNFSNITSIIKNPLFLSLSLSDYKINQWTQQGTSLVRIPTLWQLFERIIENLWKAKRIQEKLAANELDRQFTDANVIIDRLSKLMLNRPGQPSINMADAKELIPSKIIELLDAARLIHVEHGWQGFRFIHPLFADFFAAVNMSLSSVSQYLDDSVWHQAVIILATRDSSSRKAIQRQLVQRLPEKNSRWDWAGIYSLLSAVGDATVVNTLIDHYKSNKSLPALKTIARIANRLPDENSEKQKAIQIIREIMFSADWMTNIDTDVIYTGLDWYMDECMDGAEAMALIQSPQALDALIELLEKTSRFFENKPMSGSFFREQTFASYLGGMGIWAIPRLLDAINSDHEDVSATISAALLLIKRPLDAHNTS